LPKQKILTSEKSEDNTEDTSEITPELLYVRPYALGTLHLINYKLIGYELGELKRVETVLKGETRKQTSRQSSKDIQVINDNVDNDHENNHVEQILDKDFTSQIQKTLAERKVTTSNDYTTKYQPTEPNTSTKANWTIDDSPAGGDAENQSKFIKDILAETKDRVVLQVNQARQTKIENENEYSNINTFANTSERNINGFYYWLNKTYRVKASDSQKRLLIEVDFPLKDNELQQILAEEDRLTLQPPETLQQCGINSYTDISPERVDDTDQDQQEIPLKKAQSNYYLDLCQQFSVAEVATPLVSEYSIATTIKSNQNASNTTISIPDGYRVTSADVVISAGSDVESISVIVGDATPITKESSPFTYSFTVSEETSNDSSTGGSLANNIYGSLPIAILAQFKTQTKQDDGGQILAPIGLEQTNQVINIQVKLTRNVQALNQWQFTVFNQLEAGYQQQLVSYNKKSIELKQWLKENSTPKTQALINNYLIKKCMHRLYLNAMLCVGVDVATPLDELPYNQYFNNALDWSNLYCKLSEKVQTDTRIKPTIENITTQGVLAQLDDELYLKRFLTATKAKVLIPVNKDQVISFIYFLDSGQIWHGKEELSPVNNQALSIVNDFKKLWRPYDDEDIDQGSWQISLPTTMSILSNQEDLGNIGSHLYEQ